MVDQFGIDVVDTYMQYVQVIMLFISRRSKSLSPSWLPVSLKDNAEEMVRKVIDALEPGSFEYKMDDGCTVRVTYTNAHMRSQTHYITHA